MEAATEAATKWAGMLCKLTVLGVVALGALPALLGVFMELALMPFRCGWHNLWCANHHADSLAIFLRKPVGSMTCHVHTSSHV